MRKIKKFAVVLLTIVCAMSAFVWWQDTHKKAAEEEAYAQLREAVGSGEFAATETVSSPETTAAEETTEEAAGETYEAPAGLKELMSGNDSVIGWLTIADTKVDYPICQDKTDNEFFLHRDMNGKKSSSGSIYLDSNHDIDVAGLHVVYGHNMKNGSMFKTVSRFVNADYMRSHQTITVWTGEREIRLKPVACYAGPADGGYRSVISSADELHKFIKDRCGAEIASDNVFVFITCSYGQEDERTYLICEEEAF